MIDNIELWLIGAIVGLLAIGLLSIWLGKVMYSGAVMLHEKEPKEKE